MKIHGLFFTLFFLIVSFVQAQDTLYFINGKIKPVFKVSSSDSMYTVYQNRKDGPYKRISNIRLFSYKSGSRPASIIYRQDTTLQGELTQEQMSAFVRGQQDALKYYKEYGSYSIGILAGALSGVLIYIYPVASPLPVLSGAVVTNLISPSLSNITVPNKELLENPAYVMGYQKKATELKTKRVLKTGGTILLGTAAGFALFLTPTNRR